MTTATQNDPERDGGAAVGIPVDRTVRPPLGLRPEWICRHYDNRNRLIEIVEAMTRYAQAGVPVSIDWCEELERRIESYVPRNGGRAA